MNLHPVFVHFPIALLTIYALMELVRFKKIMAQPYWFYLKAVFLMVGGLGALAATYTGDMARSAVRQGDFVPAIANFKQVLSTHENFAHLSVAIFGLLAAAYLFAWINKEIVSLRGGVPPTTTCPTKPWRSRKQSYYVKKISESSLWRILTSYSNLLLTGPVSVIFALAGLICITITGGLGGVMVYGPSADPFFGIIYHLMFPGM
ncbi:MAG: hypothetical protein P4L74_02055 [Candidatus Doudnabacteria bacterium]|nr:hypothetical protein [Candidatus Doudnabacteria bacterium]